MRARVLMMAVFFCSAALERTARTENGRRRPSKSQKVIQQTWILRVSKLGFDRQNVKLLAGGRNRVLFSHAGLLYVAERDPSVTDELWVKNVVPFEVFVQGSDANLRAAKRLIEKPLSLGQISAQELPMVVVPSTEKLESLQALNEDANGFALSEEQLGKLRELSARPLDTVVDKMAVLSQNPIHHKFAKYAQAFQLFRDGLSPWLAAKELGVPGRELDNLLQAGVDAFLKRAQMVLWFIEHFDLWKQWAESTNPVVRKRAHALFWQVSGKPVPHTRERSWNINTSQMQKDLTVKLPKSPLFKVPIVLAEKDRQQLQRKVGNRELEAIRKALLMMSEPTPMTAVSVAKAVGLRRPRVLTINQNPAAYVQKIVEWRRFVVLVKPWMTELGRLEWSGMSGQAALSKVVRLLLQGKSRADVAKEASIPEQTVNYWYRRILDDGVGDWIYRTKFGHRANGSW